VVRDHPGECPICSMTLVPKPERPAANGTKPPATVSSVSGLAEVNLTPERIQLIGMRTASVKREALGGELRTVGVVAANERGLAQINTRFSGWLQKLLVSQTGEHVRRGQILATIYSPDVLRAEQELLVAHGWNAAAPAGATGTGPQEHDDFARGLDVNARGRLELLGISAQEIDEILRTGKAMEATAIRSPVDGYVVGKNAVAGVAVQPGTVLFEVADLSQVWVIADVYEQDISRVKVGQRARLELSSFPGEIHAGKVSFISPTLDSGNRTLRVRLEFKNRSDGSGPRLRPGMYGTVYLELPSTTALMVPTEAVVDTGEAHYLFVAKAGGRFEPRVVRVGAHSKDKVEILSGVGEGETVVTTGNFLVDSESRLRAAIEGQK
jgi:membrane fusion protein, copper/silver efflux system